MAFTISYNYNIVDKYSRPLGSIIRKTERFTRVARKAQKSTKNFSNKMMGMQSTLMSAAGVIGGAAVIGQFMNYAQAMNRLKAVTLSTDEQMATLAITAKELGIKTQFSAGEAAQGMTFLAMAGLNANQVLEAIPNTLKLAAAGNIGLAEAADIATNVLAQMKMEVSELGVVNDVLAKLQASANTNIYEAAEAMKNTGAQAKALGFNIQETAGLIGTLANAGLKSGEAGTLLRNAMLFLIRPTGKARKAFRELGLDLKNFTTPEGKIKNFTGLIQQLNEKGATTSQVFDIFQQRGGRAVQLLMARGAPEIRRLTKLMEESGGTADRMAKIMMEGLPGVWKEMKSSLEGLTLAIFESGLAEFLIKSLKGATGLVRKMSKMNPLWLQLIAIAGGVVAIGGPLLITLGLAATAISGLSGVLAAFGITTTIALGPIGWIIAGIAALTIGTIWLYKNWDKVIKFVKKYPALGLAIAPFLLIVAQIKLVVAGIKWLKTNWDWLWAGVKATAEDLVKYSPLGLLLKGISAAKSLVGKMGGKDDGGVAAQGAALSMEGTLNGKIDVTAEGAKINKAELGSTIPGDLGFNMPSGA